MDHNRIGWWSIQAWNEAAVYAYGTQAEAERYADRLDRGREINLHGAEWLGATDAEAQRYAPGLPPIGTPGVGINLGDELAGGDA